MVSATFADLCGRIAPVAAIVVFLAPLPTIHQCLRDKTVGNLPLLPYSSMTLSAFLWTTYGLLIQEPNVYLTNLVGLTLGVYYFTQFIRYAPKQSSTLPGSVRQHQQVVGATMLATALLYLSGLPSAVNIIGTAAVILCLAMFGSPLAALRVVLETKSAKAIPLPFTAASIVNCFCWTVFGIFKMNDANIYLPNALGLGFALIQLSLKMLYGGGGTISRKEQKVTTKTSFGHLADAEGGDGGDDAAAGQQQQGGVSIVFV